MISNLGSSLRAISIIIGTIIGVGIFGLPYTFNKAGFLIGLGLLIIIAIVFYYLHLLYGEIVLRTKKNQRLVGYAQKYLGHKGKMIAAISALFGLLGSQLAYLIVGGQFLSLITHNILGDNALIYVIVFLIAGALIVLIDGPAIATVEFFMSLFLIGVICLIFFAAVPKIHSIDLKSIHPSGIFLAYGVVLFALSGGVAIPEAIEYLKKKKNQNYKRVIVLGTLIPAFLYLLFVLAILGTTGNNVSESAIASLNNVLGVKIVILGAVFGIIAVFSSFITIGSTLMKILWYDYHVPKIMSWTLSSVAPLALFVIGMRNFIDVIGVVGTIMGGIDGILIILIFQKARKTGDQKPAYHIRFPRILKWTLVFVFLLGIVYQIYVSLPK